MVITDSWLIDWLIDLQSLQSFVNKHLSKLSLEIDNIDSQVLMKYRVIMKWEFCPSYQNEYDLWLLL